MSLFIRIRKALSKLHNRVGGLSFRDVVAMIFVYSIIILNLMQAFFGQMNFFWTQILGEESCNSSILCNYLFLVFYHYIYPLKEFLTALSFCYLYYQQGKQSTRFI